MTARQIAARLALGKRVLCREQTLGHVDMRTLTAIGALAAMPAFAFAGRLEANDVFDFHVGSQTQAGLTASIAAGQVEESSLFSSNNSAYFSDLMFTVAEQHFDSFSRLTIHVEGEPDAFVMHDLSDSNKFTTLRFNIGLGTAIDGLDFDGFDVISSTVASHAGDRLVSGGNQGIVRNGNGDWGFLTHFTATPGRSVVDLGIDSILWTFDYVPSGTQDMYDNGGSPTMVPMPTAAGLGLLGLAGVSARRRR
ncbi:MAG: hypothetical protein AAGB51_11030 [Planctomycetota bacterium]